MGRVISGTLATIIAPGKREIDYTIDITFPDASEFHFGTSPMTGVNGHTYTNDLQKVGEIRQTWEAPADQVSISLQNRDRVLGQHLAANPTLWQSANAVVGRNYYQVNPDGTRSGSTAWIEMFRGAIQQPNAGDTEVVFTIITDTLSPGQIVCSRTESPTCGFVFKDPKTCAYSGAATVCDHHLKSVTGCDGLANSHHFGGTEHRYNPDLDVPGTAGNSSGHGSGCPRLDQYLDVRGPDGEVLAKQCYFVRDDDWVWDPTFRRFFPLRTARVIRDVPIWQMIAENGAECLSSFSHRVMPHPTHPTGLPAETFGTGQQVLTDSDNGMLQSTAAFSAYAGKRGDVLFIEMAGGHHYSAGVAPDAKIVAHNSKGDPIP